jgi:hypothetical protein
MENQIIKDRKRVLAGDYSQDFVLKCNESRDIFPNNKFHIYISANFYDSISEREIILSSITKKFQDRARINDIELIFIDMSICHIKLDSKAWLNCNNELIRCRKESNGLNFISLQSNQSYGYMHLPYYISKVDLDIILVEWKNKRIKLENEEKKYLKELNKKQMKQEVLSKKIELKKLENNILVNDNEKPNTGMFSSLLGKKRDKTLLQPLDNKAIEDIEYAKNMKRTIFSKEPTKEEIQADKLNQIKEKKIIEDLSLTRNKEIKQLLENENITKNWYILDSNCIPPTYIHKSINQKEIKLYKHKVYPLLCQILSNISISNSTTDGDMYISRSITEWEIKNSFNSYDNISKCYWFNRIFDNSISNRSLLTNEIDIKNEDKDFFIEKNNDRGCDLKLTNLHAFMKSMLPMHLIIDLHVISSCNNVTDGDNDEDYKDYITAFEEEMLGCISDEFDILEDYIKNWSKDGCGLDIEGIYLNDIMYHIQISYNYINKFECFREKLKDFLKIIMNTIQKSCLNIEKNKNYSNKDDYFQGISLVVVGKSGSGIIYYSLFISIRIYIYIF